MKDLRDYVNNYFFEALLNKGGSKALLYIIFINIKFLAYSTLLALTLRDQLYWIFIVLILKAIFLSEKFFVVIHFILSIIFAFNQNWILFSISVLFIISEYVSSFIISEFVNIEKILEKHVPKDKLPSNKEDRKLLALSLREEISLNLLYNYINEKSLNSKWTPYDSFPKVARFKLVSFWQGLFLGLFLYFREAFFSSFLLIILSILSLFIIIFYYKILTNVEKK